MSPDSFHHPTYVVNGVTGHFRYLYVKIEQGGLVRVAKSWSNLAICGYWEHYPLPVILRRLFHVTHKVDLIFV